MERKKGVSKKITCSFYKCKRVVYNKINNLCKGHNWEKKITTTCLWDSFRENPVFHSLSDGKQEMEINSIFKRRFSSESCFKFQIKESIKNNEI